MATLAFRDFFGSVASTGGTGSLTIGADAPGRSGLADIDPGVAAEIDYVIFDGSQTEWGTGTVNSGGTTFTRDTISGTVTSDGTRNETSPAALNISVGAKILWMITSASAAVGYGASMNQGVATTDSPTFQGLSLTKAGVLALAMLNSAAATGMDFKADADAARITAIAATPLGLGAGGVDDQLVLNVDGTITAADSVGIGRAPTSALDIVNSATPIIRMGYGGVNAEHRIAWDSAGLSIEAATANGSALSYLIFKTLGSTRLEIDDTGVFDFKSNTLSNIGNATFAGDVVGGYFYNRASNATSIFSGGSSYNLGANILARGESHVDAGDMQLRNGSVPWLSWDASASDATCAGNLVMGGRIRLLSGTEAAPGLVYASDPDTGMRAVDVNGQAIVCGGVDQLTITTTSATFAGTAVVQNANAETVFAANNTGTGDPVFRWRINGISHGVMGLDASDGNKLKIASANIGTSPFVVFDASDNSSAFGGPGTFTGLLTANGGAKISVQNAVNGGNNQGIFLWDTNNSSWGLYMATAGAGKSLNNSATCSSLDGRTGYHVRLRLSQATQNGFIIEDGLDNCLASLTADSGNLYTKGSVNAGGDLSTAGMFNLGTPTTLTCSADAITVTRSNHRVSGEGAAADDLSTINGGSDGDIITLKCTSATMPITVKHNVGNIYLNGSADFVLASERDKLRLQYDGDLSEWHEIGRGDNG